MRRPHFRLTVRWLLAAVAISAGLVWAVMMAKRMAHYRAMADMQAKLEAGHRLEEQHLRADGPTELAEMEAEQANLHDHLKQQYRRLATHPWEHAPPDLPLPYPWNATRDREVLEVVLRDLFDPKNPANAIYFRTADGQPRPEIVLAETTYRWSGNLPQLDLPPEKLTRRNEESSNNAWSNLRLRNSGGPVLLAQLGLRRPGMIRYVDPERLFDDSMKARMWFGDYFQKRYPRACGFAWVTLPGYSPDGRGAAVFLAGGFSDHGVTWTYDVEHTDLRWVVRDRRCYVGE